MASRLYIFPPIGKPFQVYYHEGQDKRRIVTDVLLPRWEEYCEMNWLSENNEDRDCPEIRVKRFLDSCGYLLLRDNPEGTLTTYKIMARGRSEIPVSSCPASLSDLLYGDAAELREGGCVGQDEFNLILEEMDENVKRRVPKAKKKAPVPERKSDRIERIRQEHPGSRFTFCRVDTENEFLYQGVRYKIDEDMEAYIPMRTREGTLYDMDEVVVVHPADGSLQFYDANMYALGDAVSIAAGSWRIARPA